MTYLSAPLSKSIPPENLPFWENCNARLLTFQKCTACGHSVHPPLPVCPNCQSSERMWTVAPAEARVFSFTWAHTAAHGSVKDALPYNIVVVEFPPLPEVRLVSNVINVRPGELAIGDTLQLVWEECDGQWLPRFEKHQAPAGGE